MEQNSVTKTQRAPRSLLFTSAVTGLSSSEPDDFQGKQKYGRGGVRVCIFRTGERSLFRLDPIELTRMVLRRQA